MVNMRRKRDKAATTQKAPHRKAPATETLEHYPVAEPFTTITQVQDYLGGVFIVCLLCGRKMKALATHLLRVHSVGADNYRERYGIPWSFGLVPAISREKIAQAQKLRWDNGTSPIRNYDGAKSRSMARSTKPRGLSGPVRKMRKDNIESIKPVECVCSCGEPFIRGPHSGAKKVCDGCYRVNYPGRFIKSVEISCSECGALFEKGPTAKRITCPICLKKAKRERKNARRNSGRPVGRPRKERTP